MTSCPPVLLLIKTDKSPNCFSGSRGLFTQPVLCLSRPAFDATAVSLAISTVAQETGVDSGDMWIHVEGLVSCVHQEINAHKQPSMGL